jgi:GNAT superfamily N-acetyltransferase
MIPALLIGRFGVDVRHQGEGYGAQIMALVREWILRLPIGCRVIGQGAIRFYQREGFTAAPIEVARNMQWMFYDLEVRP